MTDEESARELATKYGVSMRSTLAIVQAVRAERDAEWAAAFHRGDWFEGEPDMTLEAFQKHGDNRRGSFDEVSRVSHEQGVKDGIAELDAELRRAMAVVEAALSWNAAASETFAECVFRACVTQGFITPTGERK